MPMRSSSASTASRLATSSSSPSPPRSPCKATVAFSPETPLEPAYGGGDSSRRSPLRGRHHHQAGHAGAGSRLPTRAAARRSRRERPRRRAAAKCRQTDANMPSNSRCRSSGAAGSRCGNSRSFTRTRSPCWSRENPYGRHGRARSGRSPASINSGAFARAGLRRRNASRPKRPTRRRGRSTAGLPRSRRRSGRGLCLARLGKGAR